MEQMGEESNPLPRVLEARVGPSDIGLPTYDAPSRIRTGTVRVLSAPPPTNWAKGADSG